MDYSLLKNILFLDLETVSEYPDFSKLDERMQVLWQKKASYLVSKESPKSPGQLYEERAAISAEFGKIITIGVGFFLEQEGRLLFRCKALTMPEEKQILQQFAEMLAILEKKEKWQLCAHNGKEFDFPYLCRRMLIHQLPLPKPLQVMGKKPWETQLLDTMEMWKFGDYKAYTSLELMAACLGVPTSKDDIDGSQVGSIFYKEGDIGRIAQYCMKDVAVLAQVYMRLLGLGALAEDQIQFQN